jgi:hypothetical protein
MASNAKKQIQYPVQPVLLQSLETLMTNIDSPYKLIYGCILILIIVYSSVIPSDYKLFADSLLGRVFGIGIIYGVIQSVGWIYGLLTAMAFLLILHGSRSTLQEGFDGGGTISEKKIIGKRWFVEKVLGETPSKIAVDRVITAAPGDS